MITKLELEGFKSFNRRFSMPLSNGFTAIVGPNGSGKSNILDAICFVLGKTSAKSMRAERLTHLIYNGGKRKGPANFLEVSLFIDNKDRKLPYETDSVEVSRRLTRKGTMTFKINGTRSTLGQITDVLSSTLFSPTGHNIILQGDVTNLIEMSPLERRQILDEVCGIADYDEKMEKAEKDLGAVEDRIKELVIVMAERKKHMDGLKKEKEAAEKYQKLKDEAAYVEANLIFSKFKNAEGEESQIQKKIDEEEEELGKLKDEVSGTSKQISEKGEELKKLDHKLIQSGGGEQLEIKNELASIRGQIEIKKSTIDSKRGEISGLDTLINKMQSLGEDKGGGKMLPMLKEEFTGVYGKVSDLISSDPKYRTAIDAAMGNRKNFIVVDTETTALACIDFLKQNKMGRTTFLPINKIKSPPLKGIKGMNIFGLAINLSKFDPKFQNIFNYVLGSTHIVKDLKSTKTFIGKARMVSLDGDIAEKSGALTGGFRKGKKSASDDVDSQVRERDMILDQIRELEEEIESLKVQLEGAEKKDQEAGDQFKSMQKQRDSLQEEIDKLRDKRESIVAEKDSTERRISDLRVDKARIDARLVDIKIEMGKVKEKDLKVGKIDDLARRLSDIGAEIIALEPVNMKAIELYESTIQAFKEFEEKFSKLQEERKSVLDFIDQIETKKKEVFFSVYDKVAEEFSTIFPKLSPNGEGNLHLESQEDPLSGGLLIEAKPAGKKVLSLDAMSGGEKVITALSFIFALQRYRPAPFYVLDEVDAALDPHNSMRFVDLLHETVSDAQLLIVSHNPSVIKRADRLFGVSMTTDGESKVVGLELGDVQKLKLE
jgi:chromosome segregation protein